MIDRKFGIRDTRFEIVNIAGLFGIINWGLNKKIRPIRRKGKRVGRNDPCDCGSGKKFKRCCIFKLHI